MYCRKCGKEISENSFYCKFCGNSVKGESMNINMDVIITFLKSRTKELFIFGMWFLFNILNISSCAKKISFAPVMFLIMIINMDLIYIKYVPSSLHYFIGDLEKSLNIY